MARGSGFSRRPARPSLRDRAACASPRTTWSVTRGSGAAAVLRGTGLAIAGSSVSRLRPQRACELEEAGGARPGDTAVTASASMPPRGRAAPVCADDLPDRTVSRIPRHAVLSLVATVRYGPPRGVSASLTSPSLLAHSSEPLDRAAAPVSPSPASPCRARALLPRRWPEHSVRPRGPFIPAQV